MSADPAPNPDRSDMPRMLVRPHDGSPPYWEYEDGYIEDARPEDIPLSPVVAALQQLAEIAPPKLWVIDPAAPVIPIDPEKLAAMDALGVRQPRLRRLLLALTYRGILRTITGTGQDSATLAGWVWPGGTLPHDWRRQLTRLGAAAVKAGWLDSFALNPDGTFASLRGTTFYGALTDVLFAVDADGKTGYAPSLVLAYAKPGHGDRAIVQKLIANGVCDANDNYGGHDDAATRKYAASLVADYHRQNADLPSIARLRSQGKLVMAFLPALLGTPPDARTARVMHTLIGERSTGTTRAAKIRDGKVANYSGRDLWICPLLDAAATYATFGGNHVAHRGCGYRPPHWAKLYGTTVTEFYADLAAVAEALGLIVVGVDRQRHWYTLDELQAVPNKTNVAVRIYADDAWAARWAVLCKWQPDTTPPSPDDPAPDSGPAERQILRSRVQELGGVKAVAKAMGLKGHSALSLALSGKRTSPRLVAALRKHIADAAPAVDPAKAFSGITEDSTMGDWALAYRRLGWQVLPLRPGTTATYFRYKDAGYQVNLATEDEVRQWWTQWPDADIGLLLGPISGVFAIDCDTQDGYIALLRELVEEPKAPNVMSGSYDTEHWWKMHWLFRHPDLVTNARYTPWDEGLEFRGTNGLLRLPPSISQKTGRQYAWVDGQTIWEMPLPKVPAKILLALRKRLEKPAPLKLATPTPSRSPKGHLARALAGEFAHQKNWNNNLYIAAAIMKKKGIPLAEAEAKLLDAFDPVDDTNESQARKTIRSAYAGLRIAR